MASVHQAAAKRKTTKKKFKGKYPGPDKYKGKKPFKGKYPGPDKYKGKPPPKKAPAKPAPKPAAAAAPKPNSPTLPAPGGVNTDSNGNIKLQTNAAIEQLSIDAQQEHNAAVEAANANEGESLLTEQVSKNQALDTDMENRTKGAGNMAARGMHGTAAQAASARIKKNYLDSRSQISLRRGQEQATNARAITTAGSNWDQRKAAIEQARKDYTDSVSKDNPTVGSTPVDSGVTPTKATPVAVKAAAARKAAAKPAAKKFKGKYPGPDKYKGKKPFKGKRPGPG
jgi:hypothetical protein